MCGRGCGLSRHLQQNKDEWAEGLWRTCMCRKEDVGMMGAAQERGCSGG